MRVISGKDKGKSGVVVRALPKEDKVVVEDVALYKRSLKGSQGKVGTIVERSRPIHVSNVTLVSTSKIKSALDENNYVYYQERQQSAYLALAKTFGYTSPMQGTRIRKSSSQPASARKRDKKQLRLSDRLAKITGKAVRVRRASPSRPSRCARATQSVSR